METTARTKVVACRLMGHRTVELVYGDNDTSWYQWCYTCQCTIARGRDNEPLTADSHVHFRHE